MFRVTALYLRLARDLELGIAPTSSSSSRPPPTFHNGRLLPSLLESRPQSLPSFSWVINQIRFAFGLSEEVDLLLEQVEWNFCSELGLNDWTDWQAYSFLPASLESFGDQRFLGREVSTEEEWERMFGWREGMFGSEFLKGQLVLRVVSPSREDEISSRRQHLLSTLPQFAVFTLPIEAVQTLRLEPKIPISSIDFTPVLQVLASDEKLIIAANEQTFSCTLSDGLHYISALLPVNLSWRSWTPVRNSMVQLLSFSLDFEQPSPLIVTRFGILQPARTRIGNPSDVVARPRAIIADVFDALFSIISDSCLPLPCPDAHDLRDLIGILSACALVNKAWNALATPYLYRHIALPSRGPAQDTSTYLVKSLRSNAHLVRFIRPLHHPILRSLSFRQRCLTSKLDRLLSTNTFPSLAIIRGLAINPYNISLLSSLSRHAPSLRELSLEVTFGSHERNTARFQNARGIGTIDLPSSLEALFLSMDVGVSFSQYVLKRLVETGESTLGGVAVTRSLPNLRRLHLEFVVQGDVGDDASPLALDASLPELRRLLARVGSSLTHLGLTEKYYNDTRDLHSTPSFPLHSLLSCPSLRILAVDGLRLEPLLLAQQPHPYIEQIDIGLTSPSDRDEDELSFGCGWFDPGATGSSNRDGALLRELVESFERARFPRLRRVRLTCADWRFEKHRRLRGLKEKVRAFRFMGLELVDFEGRVWWE